MLFCKFQRISFFAIFSKEGLSQLHNFYSYFYQILIDQFSNFAMSRENSFGSVTPVLSPVKSDKNSKSILISGLFSKEFLECLKNELSSHAKEIKPQDVDYKQALVQLKKYQKQKEAMSAKLENLISINHQLKKKLEMYELDKGKQINTVIESPQTTRLLKIIKNVSIQQSVNISIMPGTASQQILYLKERVERLEISKAIKDQRINEMLEKQVRLQSQINLLKVKNYQLEDLVASLRKGISRIFEEKEVTSTIVSDKYPDIEIGYQFDSDQPTKSTQSTNSQLLPNKNINLMSSLTSNVRIPDNLTLSKVGVKKKISQAKEFNQIDYLIEEDLPYIDASDEFKGSIKEQAFEAQQITNINESLVLINLNNS